ncbi:MAG: MFS transporter [SAR92 clade bacterium]|uniref:MFS transporter n=1 Tax=SAR92 clade bacterium TaxID=2315479 RepID=A0A520MEW5_9GAMM|nr:MAG: MFS transporter [SAR92 clade bacterium]
MGIIFSKDYKNAWVLSLSNAVAGSILPLMHLAGTLAGSTLAPSPSWATAPIALMILGTASSVVLVTRTMQNLGRKMGIYVFLGVGLLVCMLAMTALEFGSFSLFCLASFMLGSFNATLLQGRFAAMESVGIEHRTTAASMFMGSGIIAAFIGPEIALIGKDVFSTAYQGSFLLAAGCILISSLMLTAYTPKLVPQAPDIKSNLPKAQLFKNPTFCLALASGTIAYVVMSFIMTGTPISMHESYGHSLTDTKWVLQSHIAAMFLPSFITPVLVRYMGLRGMMVAGLVCYCLAIAVGYSDNSPQGFWTQLVLLGIGWNFLFIGGTTLLPDTHHENERFKAQSINDFTVFSFQALAALSAGWALNLIGWQPMVLLCLIPVAIMLMALLWERIKTRKMKSIS